MGEDKRERCGTGIYVGEEVREQCRTGRCAGEEAEKRERRQKQVTDTLTEIGSRILDLLYPPRCPICQRILPAGGERVCKVCRAKLPFIREPLCKKCGKPLYRDTEEYCTVCRKMDHAFIRGRSTFVYEKEFRESVQRMKFYNHREYLDFYAEEMVRSQRAFIRAVTPSVLIPVPMNEKKRRERGFDQSRLLAVKIGRLTGIPVDTESLIRQRYTLPQKELGAQERISNLKNAFRLLRADKIREPVLLIDDIYTTGSTIDEICRTLHEAGITQVYFLALCTGRPVRMS